MCQEQHRKLQFKIRNVSEYCPDKVELSEQDLTRIVNEQIAKEKKRKEKYDRFDDSRYIEANNKLLKSRGEVIIDEEIENKGKPALVLMNIAQKIIQKQELENPSQKKLTELQKGRVAIDYMKMNSRPDKFKYLKRFLDNKGDINIPGFDPIKGKRGGKSLRMNS